MKHYPLENTAFFWEEENLEIVYDEEEKLKIIYEILQSIDAKVQILKGGFDTYEGSCNLWIKNIMNYAKEAYNSIQIGNFISLAIMMRCIVENYVCACFVKRYKDERLWEKWFISSMVADKDMLYKSNNDKQKQEKAQKEIDGFCNEIGITINWNTKDSYGWTSEILKKKKPNFFNLCEFINPSIYKDYRYLCNYCHGINAINKVYRFTFYETYLNLLSILVLYVQRSAEELVGDLLDQTYWNQIELFWNMLKENIR